LRLMGIIVVSLRRELSGKGHGLKTWLGRNVLDSPDKTQEKYRIFVGIGTI
jgi:hypothetical protein